MNVTSNAGDGDMGIKSQQTISGQDQSASEAVRFIEVVLRKAEIVHFPSHPLVLDRVFQTVRDEWNVEAVTAWLAFDPCLVMRLLMASVSGSEFAEKDEASLEERVQKLGPGLIRTILIGAVGSSVLADSSKPGAFDFRSFWSKSVRCGRVAHGLAEAMAYPRKQEAYLVGLLHDIGAVAASTEDFQYPFHRDASSYSGLVTAEIGASLLEELRLGSRITGAILLQNARFGELQATPVLTRILRAAKALIQENLTVANLEEVSKLTDLAIDTVYRIVDNADRGLFDEIMRRLGNDKSAVATTFGAENTRNSDKLSAVLYPSGADLIIPEGSTVGSLLSTVLQESIRAEVALLLTESREFGSVLARIRAILSAAAGLSEFLLFTSETGDEPFSGLKVVIDGLARLDIELSSRVESGIVGQALREVMPVISGEQGENIRFTGMDVLIARALRAEVIGAVPLKGLDRQCCGILVFGTRKERVADFKRKLPLLKGLADAVAIALRKLGKVHSCHGLTERESVEAFRMATRRLVHEARNPLSILKASVEIAKRRLGEGKNLSVDLDIFAQEIDRVTRLIDLMGKGGLSTEPNREPIGINQAIKEFLQVYEIPLFQSRNIRVELDLDETIPVLLSNAHLVKQALLNLLKNASEAMPAGGCVRIGTSDFINLEGQMMVEIAVSDTGPGIPAQKLVDLFKLHAPSGTAPGRGLGLANSLQSIRDIGGRLFCQSRSGEGAKFTIMLPRVVDLGATPGCQISKP